MDEMDSIPAASTEHSSCKSAHSEGAEMSREHRMEHRSWRAHAVTVGLLILLAALTLMLAGPDPAHAAYTARASAYGPGLYGNRTACGQTLRPGTIGVAHRSFPCGAMVWVSYRGRSLRVPVIDRGPYASGRTFDFTNGLVTRGFRVSSCSAWGVRTISWRRA